MFNRFLRRKRRKKKIERKVNISRFVKTDSFSIFKSVKVNKQLYWNIHFTKFDSRFFTRSRNDRWFFSNKFSFNSGFSSFSRLDTKIGKLSSIASFFFDLYNKFCFLNDYSIYRSTYLNYNYNYKMYKKFSKYQNISNNKNNKLLLRFFSYSNINNKFLFFLKYVRSFFTFHFFLNYSDIITYRSSPVFFFSYLFFFLSCRSIFYLQNVLTFFFPVFFFRFFYSFFFIHTFFSLFIFNFLFFFSFYICNFFFSFFFFLFFFVYYLFASLYSVLFFSFFYSFIFFSFSFIIFNFLKTFFFFFLYKSKFFFFIRSFFSKYKYKYKYIFISSKYFTNELENTESICFFFFNKLLFSSSNGNRIHKKNSNSNDYNSNDNKKKRPKARYVSPTYSEEEFLSLWNDVPRQHRELSKTKNLSNNELNNAIFYGLNALFSNKNKKTEFTIREHNRHSNSNKYNKSNNNNRHNNKSNNNKSNNDKSNYYKSNNNKSNNNNRHLYKGKIRNRNNNLNIKHKKIVHDAHNSIMMQSRYMSYMSSSFTFFSKFYLTSRYRIIPNSKRLMFVFFSRVKKMSSHILFFVELNSRLSFSISMYIYSFYFISSFFLHFFSILPVSRITLFLKSKIFNILFFNNFMYGLLYKNFLRGIKLFFKGSIIKLFPFFFFSKIKYMNCFFHSKCFSNSVSYFYNSLFYRYIRNKSFLKLQFNKNALFGRRIFNLLRSKLYRFFFYNKDIMSLFLSKRVKLKLISFFFYFFFLRKRRGSFSLLKLRRLLWRLLFRGRYFQQELRLYRSSYNRLSHARRFSYYIRNGFHYNKIVNMYFFLNYFDINFFDFYNLCKNLNLWNLTFYSVFSLFEMSRYTFLSNNFFCLYNSSVIFFNNVRFIFDYNSKFHSISIGDLLEFRFGGHSSCYSGSYILLFNIFFFCRSNFLRKLWYKSILSIFYLFILKKIKNKKVDFYMEFPKLFHRKFVFYPGWCFRRSYNKYLFRPLHYYFSGLLYKVYMPWLSFNSVNMLQSSGSFVRFINKLDSTHKLYITHFFGKLSFNLHVFFLTNWSLDFFLFNSLFSFFYGSAGYWSYFYCCSIFIRSILANRLFNSFCFKYNSSNHYVISSSLKLGTDFNKKKLEYISKRGISFFFNDFPVTELSSSSESGINYKHVWRTPFEIINRINNVEKYSISTFIGSKKLKQLPWFIYSLFFRRQFFFSLFKDNMYKLSRKYFIFFSSFSLMYKRVFDTFDSNLHLNQAFPLFTYKLYHSNLLSNLFYGSYYNYQNNLYINRNNRNNIIDNKYFFLNRSAKHPHSILGRVYNSYKKNNNLYLKFRVKNSYNITTKRLFARGFGHFRRLLHTITRPIYKKKLNFFRFYSFIPIYNKPYIKDLFFRRFFYRKNRFSFLYKKTINGYYLKRHRLHRFMLIAKRVFRNFSRKHNIVRYILNSWWFKERFYRFWNKRRNRILMPRKIKRIKMRMTISELLKIKNISKEKIISKISTRIKKMKINAKNTLKKKLIKINNTKNIIEKSILQTNLIRRMRLFFSKKHFFIYKMFSKYRHLIKSRRKFKITKLWILGKLPRRRRRNKLLYSRLKVLRIRNLRHRLISYRKTKQLSSFLFSYIRNSRYRHFLPVYRRRRWHINKYWMRIIRARRINNRIFFKRNKWRFWHFLRNARASHLSFFSIFDKNDPDIAFIFHLLNSSIFMLNSIFIRFDSNILNYNKLSYFIIRTFLLKSNFLFSYLNRYKFPSFFYKIYNYRSSVYKYKFRSILYLNNNFFFFYDNW